MSKHLEKVIAIVAENLGINGEHLTEDSNLIEDCGMDSLDTIDLVIEFESEFDIDIHDEEYESWKTLGDICKTVEGKVTR